MEVPCWQGQGLWPFGCPGSRLNQATALHRRGPCLPCNLPLRVKPVQLFAFSAAGRLPLGLPCSRVDLCTGWNLLDWFRVCVSAGWTRQQMPGMELLPRQALWAGRASRRRTGWGGTSQPSWSTCTPCSRWVQHRAAAKVPATGELMGCRGQNLLGAPVEALRAICQLSGTSRPSISNSWYLQQVNMHAGAITKVCQCCRRALQALRA